MKFSHILAAVAMAATLSAQAQPVPASTDAPLVEGEVRKVDKEQGKVTLRHGPIPNLDMDGMSMIFRVSDPKMLDTIKQGDKVKFTADKVNGVFTVMSIQAAN